jgi:hypothetical protein
MMFSTFWGIMIVDGKGPSQYSLYHSKGSQPGDEADPKRRE